MPHPSTDDVSDEVRETIAGIELPNAGPSASERLEALQQERDAAREKLNEIRAEAPDAGVMKRKKQKAQEKKRRRNRRNRERDSGQQKKKSSADGIAYEAALKKVREAGKHKPSAYPRVAFTFSNAGSTPDEVDAMLDGLNTPRQQRAQLRREQRVEERKNEMLAAVGHGPEANDEDEDEGEDLWPLRSAARRIRREYGGNLGGDAMFDASARRAPNGSHDPYGPLVTGAEVERVREENAARKRERNAANQ